MTVDLAELVRRARLVADRPARARPEEPVQKKTKDVVPGNRDRPDLSLYDRFIVGYSGGKDSTACYLHLLDLGVPRSKIELWHHCIDPEGRPFMDWPCTPRWCEDFARDFDVPLYLSGRRGGFEGGILREDAFPEAI